METQTTEHTYRLLQIITEKEKRSQRYRIKSRPRTATDQSYVSNSNHATSAWQAFSSGAKCPGVACTLIVSPMKDIQNVWAMLYFSPSLNQKHSWRDVKYGLNSAEDLTRS